MCHHSNLIPQRCVPPFSVTIPSIRTQITISPSTTLWLNTSTSWSPVCNKWTHSISSPPMRWKKRTGKHSPMKCVLLVFPFSMYVIFPPFINRISPSTILFIVLCMLIKTCQRTSVCSCFPCGWCCRQQQKCCEYDLQPYDWRIPTEQSVPSCMIGGE